MGVARDPSAALIGDGVYSLDHRRSDGEATSICNHGYSVRVEAAGVVRARWKAGASSGRVGGRSGRVGGGA